MRIKGRGSSESESRVDGFVGWVSDLGIGAWLLGLAGVVVVALVIAVVVGRNGPVTSPCQQARPHLNTLADFQGVRTPLTAPQVAQLQDDAVQLQHIAKSSYGDDTRAIKDAAALAASAQVGRSLNPLDVEQVVSAFNAACPSGGLGG